MFPLIETDVFVTDGVGGAAEADLVPCPGMRVERRARRSASRGSRPGLRVARASRRPCGSTPADRVGRPAEVDEPAANRRGHPGRGLRASASRRRCLRACRHDASRRFRAPTIERRSARTPERGAWSCARSRSRSGPHAASSSTEKKRRAAVGPRRAETTPGSPGPKCVLVRRRRSRGTPLAHPGWHDHGSRRRMAASSPMPPTIENSSGANIGGPISAL